jgi:hypothetical protein
MTPQTSQAEDKRLQAAELDRLTYSAYLLTLDPDVSISVVLGAVDGALEEIGAERDLLERTVDLALEQVRRESSARWGGESPAFDAGLYRHSAAIDLQAFQSLKDLLGSPILLLDSTSRVAFVLHHVLGYKICEAAAKARVSEKQYRAQLRNAYIQLASGRLRRGSSPSHDLGESALA